MKSESLQAHRLLLSTGLTIATAESCTGGLIAKCLTDFSGSSIFFKGGVITYTNAIKSQVLGVSISQDESAVKKRVALEMASRTAELFQSDLAIATTGFMEPSKEIRNTKAVRNATGFFFVGICFNNKTRSAIKAPGPLTWSESHYLCGTRRQNRDSASMLTLRMLNRIIWKINKRRSS